MRLVLLLRLDVSWVLQFAGVDFEVQGVERE